MCHHISTELYCSRSAQRLSERTAYSTSCRHVFLLRLLNESKWRYFIPIKQKGSYKTADLAFVANSLPSNMFSFEWFPGVLVLIADVSEPYQFHLHRQVNEVWLGMWSVVYIYLTGLWQASEGANSRRSDRVGAGKCTAGYGRGRYTSACGITVVYSVAVSYSWVCVAVVSRICWDWNPHLCWCY